MIEINHLCKSFGTLEVLKDISLTVKTGEIYGLVGRSGAGKSTLLRCINGLENYDSGSLKIDGTEIRDLSKQEIRELRKGIGMIFQQFSLIERRSVYKNVALPMKCWKYDKERIDKRVHELLELVDIADKINDRPSVLSGGQKQRVAIARALALDSNLLLCDEATSALDPKTTRDILRLIQDINKRLGITVVVITHEMKVIEEICSRVAILDHGNLAETGTVEEVFASPKSEAGRRLVYPDGVPYEMLRQEARTARVIRVAFNGGTAYQPLIASLAIDCGVKANILGADTRNIDGRAFGTMLLGLPEDETQVAKAMAYIRSQKDITVEEVPDYHE